MADALLQENAPGKRLRGHGDLFRRHQVFGLGSENKLGVAKLSHLRQIESGDFTFRRNALAKHHIEDPVYRVAESEDEADERAYADQLRHQLARVAVEQSGN